MAIPNAARPTPIPGLLRQVPIVDLKTGQLTQVAHQQQERLRGYVQSGGRIVPCSAVTASNVITLTPNTATPSLEGYRFGDCFLFWADAVSTGLLTATVVPKVNTLATLKVFKVPGSQQAGSGDITTNHLYAAFYHPILDSNKGAFYLLGWNEPKLGNFTLAAAATKVVSDVGVTAASTILLSPTNASAATLMGGAGSLYISAQSAGVSFTVATANGGNAAGTETFNYQIVG